MIPRIPVWTKRLVKYFFFSITAVVFIIGMLFAGMLFGCTYYKPIFKPNVASTWKQYASPEEAGWSSGRLKAVRARYDSLGSTALMAVYRGKVLLAWGDIEANTPVHSVRKSFLSALYGIHAGRGEIGLDKTLRELAIDDAPPLTGPEKEAKVRDLLKARSGVYHFAAAEPQTMKDGRPQRGSHAPGTFWYYNNWDFNALGTIFRQETGKDIFRALDEEIARPIGMEDFRLKNARYLREGGSIHPAYSFRMSARDMARFGQLYLQKGVWESRRIIPEAWVAESTASYSDSPGIGYGYMWWVNHGILKQYGSFSALGMYGNRIDVLPALDLVVVHRVNSTIPDKPFMTPVSDRDCEELIRMIIEAKTGETRPNPKFAALKVRR